MRAIESCSRSGALPPRMTKMPVKLVPSIVPREGQGVVRSTANAPYSASPTRRPLLRGHSRRGVGFAVYCAVLTAVFARPLTALMRHAAHNDLDSYIVYVGFDPASLNTKPERPAKTKKK